MNEFINNNDLVTRALLQRSVLPAGTPPYERMSGALAVRHTVRAGDETRESLVFLTPHVRPDMAQVLVASLLVGDFAYGHTRGPDHQILHGDVVLVTHAVGAAVSALKDVHLGHDSLSRFWTVESFSRYAPPPDDKPRVYVSNPGWMLRDINFTKTAALIIDACHPRTLSHLSDLLEASKDVPNVIVVAPPIDPVTFPWNHVRPPDVWLWDPPSQSALTNDITPPKPKNSEGQSPTFIMKQAVDEEFDGVVSDLQSQFGSAQRDFGGFDPLREAWAVFKRLCQLVVPLAESEEAAFRSYGALSLGRRIDKLRQMDYSGDSYRDARWPVLVRTLQRLYDLARVRQEPAKFWSLVESVTQFLAEGARLIRVVVPTRYEAELLNALMRIHVPAWGAAVANGQVEVASANDDARLMAERESPTHTILSGPRGSIHRYLDAFPPYEEVVLAYPSEVSVNEAILSRYYQRLEPYRTHRKDLVSKWGFKPGRQLLETPRYVNPQFSVQGSDAQTSVRPARIITTSSIPLDLDNLALLEGHDLVDDVSWTGHARGVATNGKEFVTVICEGARSLIYPINHNVEVYFPAVGDLRRVPSDELREGMHLVVMVDDVYEDLFERLVDSIRTRTTARERLDLEIWKQAKASALAIHKGSRVDLFHALVSRGLTVDYPAVVNWYSTGSAAIIAPSEFRNFKIVSDYSGIYSSLSDVERAFGAVNAERIRRRRAGRALRRFLKAVTLGDGYEAALAHARQLGSCSEDILGAIELLEIERVIIPELDKEAE